MMIQNHDSKLYCNRNAEGKLCIYRESYRWEHYFIDDVPVHFARPTPHFIMALTHNWQMAGTPVEWGYEPILARLKAMDMHNRNLAEDLIKSYEKADVSKQRDASNQNEDFLREFRPQFAKTFKDVNTSSLKKIDKRRIAEKRIKEF